MKKIILSLLTFAALGTSSVFGLSPLIQTNDGQQAVNPVEVTSPIAAIQEPAPAAPPALQEGRPPQVEGSPSDIPVEPGTVVEWDSSAPVYPPNNVYPPNTVYSPIAVHSVGGACDTCCRRVCCCKVPTTFCLVDPCDGCSYEACVHLPPCCVGIAPVVEWKNGVLGRKIISLCWPCCNKRAKVVVPVFGDVRVHE